MTATPDPHADLRLPPQAGVTAYPYALRRAVSSRDWREVEILRHDGLVERGEIAASPARAWRDEFDTDERTITFVLAAGALPLGTTRSSVTSARHRAPLPCDRVFARELAAAFGEDATLVEASLTFVDAAAAKDPRDALFRLFKAHMLHCAAEGAVALVVAARRAQMGFYRRSLNMEILSGAEPWPGMATPRVLMGVTLSEHAPLLLRRLPALATTPEEERAVAGL